MQSNVFEFQNESLLIYKDPKSFRYLKLEIFSVRIKEEETNGTWTVDTRDI